MERMCSTLTEMATESSTTAAFHPPSLLPMLHHVKYTQTRVRHHGSNSSSRHWSRSLRLARIQSSTTRHWRARCVTKWASGLVRSMWHRGSSSRSSAFHTLNRIRCIDRDHSFSLTLFGLQSPPTDFKRSVRLGEKIYICGDHRDSATFDGVVSSSRLHACTCVRHFRCLEIGTSCCAGRHGRCLDKVIDRSSHFGSIPFRLICPFVSQWPCVPPLHASPNAVPRFCRVALRCCHPLPSPRRTPSIEPRCE